MCFLGERQIVTAPAIRIEMQEVPVKYADVFTKPRTSPDWQNFGHSLAESPIHGYNPDPAQTMTPVSPNNVTCNHLQIYLDIFKTSKLQPLATQLKKHLLTQKNLQIKN